MEKRIRQALLLFLIMLLVSCNSYKDKRIYNYLEHLNFKDSTTINLEEILNMPIDSFYVFGEFSFAKRKEGFSSVESIEDIIGREYHSTDVSYHENRVIVFKNNEVVYEETMSYDRMRYVLFRFPVANTDKRIQVRKWKDRKHYYALITYDEEEWARQKTLQNEPVYIYK